MPDSVPTKDPSEYQGKTGSADQSRETRREGAVMADEAKKPYIEVTRPDTHAGLICVWPFDGFSATDEMDGAEDGESSTLPLRMMTDEEFKALGEFEGW